MEDLATLELERLPTEALHESLDIVDGSGRIGHVPQQHAREQQREIEHHVKHESHAEDAPRIDVPNDAARALQTATLHLDQWLFCRR